MTRSSSKPLISEVHVDSFISDHAVVHFTVKPSKPPPPREKKSFRRYKAIDQDAFRVNLNTSSLLVEPSDDLDSLVGQYNSVLRELVDAHAPVTSKTVPVRAKVPWYTDVLHAAKCKRRQYERKWRATGLNVHREMFKEQRQVVRTVLTREKSDYYSKKVRDCGSDQKALFSVVDSLLHKQKSSPLPNHSSLPQLLEEIGSFFKTKIDNIRAKLDGLPEATAADQSTEATGGQCAVSLCTFTPATESEVLKVIQRSPKKTCDLDPMQTQALMDYVPDLLPVITRIINTSLASGTVPASMKRALVTPLLKKPTLDRDVLQNYRPVSNLSFLSKVLERVVASRLLEYLSAHSLLEPRQSAYRACHSTETALLKVQSDLLMALDDGCAAFMVLLDLSAAFDTIDHTILLSRLSNHFGISDAALSWISSYLGDRVQSVHVKGVSSADVTMGLGVPQGSVLGPLLYTMYTCPISEIADRHGVKIHMYADDTQLYLCFKVSAPEEIPHVLSKMEACIADIRRWMLVNKLMINDQKTEFLVIVSPRQEGKFSIPGIRIGGCLIQPTVQARNLGVIFDKHLTMQAQVNIMCRQCRNAYYHLRNIGQIRGVLSQEATEKLIHAFVTSRIDNGNALLYNITKACTNKLQRVLNTAARIVSRTPRFESISPVCMRLHWLPVTARVEYKVLILTYKALHGLAPGYLADFLQQYQPGRALRSEDRKLLHVPRTRLITYGDRAFPKAAPVLWNSLPQAARDAQTLDTFKRHIKTFLFAKSYA